MSSGSRAAPSERSHYVSTLSSILPPPLTLPPRTNSSSSSGPGGAARARRGANVAGRMFFQRQPSQAWEDRIWSRRWRWA